MITPKVKVTNDNDITVVRMNGEFIGGNETDDLRDALAREADSGTNKLLIDLAGATYLNSTALGVLIAAHTNFSKRDGRIGLCNVSKNIQNIFVITKLALVFTIYDTLDDGLRAMKNTGSTTAAS
jgi:anti-anti-sigma factor